MSDTEQKELYENLIYAEDGKTALVSVDRALKSAGDEDWYQIRTTILLAIQWTIIAFILQGQPFLFLSPDFECKDPNNGSVYKCSQKDACNLANNNWENAHPWPGSSETLVVHFNLYCDRGYLQSLCQSIFFLCSNVATLIFSFLSDLKGRKYIILVTYIIGVVPLLVSPFSVSWGMFMTIFTIAGVGLNSYSGLCFVLLSESAGEEYRQATSIGLLVTWGLGQLLFIPIAYYFPSWYVLLLYWIAIPLCAQIITYIWIYESPKFLLMQKRFEDARRVIKKIASANGRSLKDFKFVEEKENEDKKKKRREQKKHDKKVNDKLNAKKKKTQKEKLVVKEEEEEDDSDEEKDHDDIIRSSLGGTLEHYLLVQNIVDQRSSLKRGSIQSSFSASFQDIHKPVLYTYLDLFRYKSLLKISLILSYAYFAVYLCYYGAIFCLNSLGGDIYYSAIYVNCAELAAYVASGPIVRSIRRKISFPICLFGLSISCILYFVSNDNTVYIILACITKFCVAIAFSLIYVYTQELYPTVVRSLGVGLCTFIGKFGCALAPIIINVFESSSLHPMVSFGLFGIVSAITVLFLKETLHEPLEDEINEITAKRFSEKIPGGKNADKSKKDEESFYLEGKKPLDGLKEDEDSDKKKYKPKLGDE